MKNPTFEQSLNFLKMLCEQKHGGVTTDYEITSYAQRFPMFAAPLHPFFSYYAEGWTGASTLPTPNLKTEWMDEIFAKYDQENGEGRIWWEDVCWPLNECDEDYIEELNFASYLNSRDNNDFVSDYNRDKYIDDCAGYSEEQMERARFAY